MLSLFLWGFIFLFAIFILIKSADYFTDSAEKIGLFFGLSPFIIGITIVAFGTSLPELVSSVYSVIIGSSEIVTGNVLGSNIANILLVLGLTGIFAKNFKIKRDRLNVDLSFLIWSAVFIFIFLIDGEFNIFEGLIGLGILIWYIVTSIKSHKIVSTKKKRLEGSVIIILLVSCIGIYLGAKYTIDSVIFFSDILGIGVDVLSTTIVAIGTSLPEVVVSLVAAKKGKAEIAVGNVLGSNIFNTYAVMGIASIFGVIYVTPIMLAFTLPIMLLATLLFLFVCYDKHVDKVESVVLFILYIVFLVRVIMF